MVYQRTSGGGPDVGRLERCAVRRRGRLLAGKREQSDPDGQGGDSGSCPHDASSYRVQRFRDLGPRNVTKQPQPPFGVAGAAESAADTLPGRLQHVVVATTRLDAMVAFYNETLGFLVSDWVREVSGEATTCFLRSDPEHHSFAAFRAPRAGLDHHAYETTCWNDIRDWADHFSGLHVRLEWGPGRHGPGNNLFFMVHDPDGSWVEISAELEHMPAEAAAREWPHEERTLNYWGQGFLRD